MGNLNDYFRAADDEAAARTSSRIGGPLVAADSGPAFDGVDAKGIDAAVALGKLIAFALDTEWNVGMVSESLVAPAMDSEAIETGPWATRLSDVARDALAAIDPAIVPGLADRWASIEEFRWMADRRQLAGTVTQLSTLARRAVEADQHLYCWSSL